jgi:hypothetical protein
LAQTVKQQTLKAESLPIEISIIWPFCLINQLTQLGARCEPGRTDTAPQNLL